MLTGNTLQGLADKGNCLITFNMTIGIIDLLEVIDIDKDDIGSRMVSADKDIVDILAETYAIVDP
jgi:hypothetical protein